jgi:hypothetical protein
MQSLRHSLRRHHWLAASMILIGLVLIPEVCAARSPSMDECREAGDFIRNAAMARDGGMSEEAFLNRLKEDIEMIQAFPPSLRWFVQDDDDAQLLLSFAEKVFQQPDLPAAHQSDFLRACIGKAAVRAGVRL